MQQLIAEATWFGKVKFKAGNRSTAFQQQAYAVGIPREVISCHGLVFALREFQVWFYYFIFIFYFFLSGKGKIGTNCNI